MLFGILIALLTFGSFTLTRAAALPALPALPAGVSAALNTARQVLVHRDTKYLLVELVAGQTLDAWLSSNPDPRQDTSGAYPNGVYWTSASYKRRATLRPGQNDVPFDPISYPVDVSQGHEINDLANIQGDRAYRGTMNLRANTTCWHKRYEIVWTGDGWPAWRGAAHAWVGTDAEPFDEAAAIAEIRRIYDDPELGLGVLLYDETETWTVGDFIVNSIYSQSSGNIHSKLRESGTYTALVTGSVATTDYSAGHLAWRGAKMEIEEFFPLDCHQSDSELLSLVGNNQMIVDVPEVSGGSDRWVEVETGRDCNHTNWWQSHRQIRTGRFRDGGYVGDSLSSPWRYSAYTLAPECQEKTKIVVKERKTYKEGN